MSGNLLTYYMLGTFSYGFLRCMRAEYIEPYNILGKKLCFSVLNGMIYASPFGIPKLFNLFDRADIYLNKKDSTKYHDVYVEYGGICKNKNVIF